MTSKSEPTEPAESASAEQAIAPHLKLLAATAERGTSRRKAAAGLMLLWLSDDVMSGVNAGLREHGITENKLHVLILFSLDERGMLDLGPLTPSVIADYCGVTRSSATGLLDWLETRELLAREHRKDDRRSLELVLTDKGREILDQALPSFWRACAHLTRELSDEDCQTLQTILAKVWRGIK
ncbi:MarR family winged helix-turn-helix transcriptional regulator [Cupriavidus sp. UME77]|uniref:MarR family winged helix-turn-helix transcriptional regulator n=1 Tax=Cupriavidus sp. UME77 TaxID=1862321 RepID=UPI0016027F59|nr:MarR family transcriptional regulator [Cupriavidus sp. UME77]MBB1631543.1 MarR family transcriptional regulator [Cupriavidus sp. UME77]